MHHLTSGKVPRPNAVGRRLRCQRAGSSGRLWRAAQVLGPRLSSWPSAFLHPEPHFLAAAGQGCPETRSHRGSQPRGPAGPAGVPLQTSEAVFSNQWGSGGPDLRHFTWTWSGERHPSLIPGRGHGPRTDMGHDSHSLQRHAGGHLRVLLPQNPCLVLSLRRKALRRPSEG